MSDIKEDKTPLAEAQIKSPISRFNRWLKSFGKRETATSTSQEQIAVPPPINIAGILDEKLREKEGLIPPEVKARGVLAILDTNEKRTPGLFEAIKEKNPNGYIIGVGVGNVFSLLNCFQEENPPKGMVLVDFDPRVVIVGKIILGSLNQAETPSDFINNFFRLPKDTFQARIKGIILGESNVVLRQRLEKIPPEEWERVIKGIQEWSFVDPYFKSWVSQDDQYNSIFTMLNKFDVLRQMARSNNISVTFSNFTNPDLIASIVELPGFRESRNIIYISNIVDHITRTLGFKFEDVSKMESLKAYENPSTKSIFIDTLQNLNYFLRARFTMPTYSQEDFVPKSLSEINEKPKEPEGLIFVDEK